MNSETKTQRRSMMELCTLQGPLRAVTKRQALPRVAAHVCDPSSRKTEAWLRPATHRGKHQKVALLLQAYLNLPEVTQKNTPSGKHLFFIIGIHSVNGIRLPASDNKMVCLSLRKSQ